MRILSGLGLASLALTIGCGGPIGVDAEEAAITNPGGISTPNPIPRPRPLPRPLPCHGLIGSDTCDWGGGYDPPVTYPDYGMTDGGSGSCALPVAIDYENWSGVSLWGSHTGVIVPYYTYNTAARVAGDINHSRLELFGVDTVANTVIWHVFAPVDTSNPKTIIPAGLLAMSGTEDPYCHPVKFGTGGLSSGKPPKDPPKPPDGTGGGKVYWCPAGAVEYDASQRVAGCDFGGP